MAEGLEVYREMLDNIKYLDTFLKLYPANRDFALRDFKYQQSARNRQFRAKQNVELLDADLKPLRAECEEFGKYLKTEHLNNILNLEEDLEWKYLEINQRFVKVFNAFAQLTEDIDYLKKAEIRFKKGRRKSAKNS